MKDEGQMDMVVVDGDMFMKLSDVCALLKKSENFFERDSDAAIILHSIRETLKQMEAVAWSQDQENQTTH